MPQGCPSRGSPGPIRSLPSGDEKADVIGFSHSLIGKSIQGVPNRSDLIIFQGAVSNLLFETLIHYIFEAAESGPLFRATL